MTINVVHPRYSVRLPIWKKIEDIVMSENVDSYLVELNPLDKSEENKSRNRQYRERAIFYALSGQTVQGMVGSVFRRWPEFDVPSALEYLTENADGAGVSIYQQSQAVVADLIAKGRSGLAVSFPPAEGQVSRAQIQSGEMVATIHRFKPEQILNWRSERRGSKIILSLVVIYEQGEKVADDGYTLETFDIIREMFIDPETRVFKERQWSRETGSWERGEEVTPTDARGQPFDEILFTFVGSENNDPEPDQPPMLGIVDLNIGHYRNSADYEDSVWFAGQPQPWMSGVTQDHIDLMKKANMYVGSRNVLGVPDGEQFGFAAAPPNTLVSEAMEKKVEMMVSLGARMMTQGSAVKTADQSRGEREAQTSLLSMIASNTSEAYTKALGWVGRFMGIEREDLAYTLNQDFLQQALDPQVAQAMMQGFMLGHVPLPDYVRFMKKNSLFDEETSIEDYAELLTRDTGGSEEDALDS
mgnify:CR=1 FL=1